MMINFAICIIPELRKNIVLFNCRSYYFSLFLELSHIAMPFIRVAVFYFRVSMIGRSLGLIFSGTTQSLGWKLAYTCTSSPCHLWKHSLSPDKGELHIFRTDTLKEMSIRVPSMKEELLDINGLYK